jgi:hypothetical protein
MARATVLVLGALLALCPGGVSGYATGLAPCDTGSIYDSTFNTGTFFR